MIARTRKLLDDLRETFWLIPAIMVVAGVLMAIGFVQIDRLGLLPEALLKSRGLYDGGGTGARTLQIDDVPFLGEVGDSEADAGTCEIVHCVLVTRSSNAPKIARGQKLMPPVIRIVEQDDVAWPDIFEPIFHGKFRAFQSTSRRSSDRRSVYR